MPDEEIIDKLVKDAANQHHPPYDDTAWGKMEVLLDKHLPQKKDRRRPIIFLLLFLLLGGGAVFFAVENANKNSTATVVAGAGEKKSGTTLPVTDAANATATFPTNNSDATTADNSLTNQLPDEKTNTITGTKQEDIAGKNSRNQNGHLKITTKNPGVADDNDNPQYTTVKRIGDNQKGRSKIAIKNAGVADGDDAVPTQKDDLVKKDIDAKGSPAVTKADNLVTEQKATDKKTTAISKTDSAATVKKETDKKPVAEKNNTAAAKQNKKKFGDKIAITLSAGADLSYIELSDAGKVKPAYGAGLSYALGKHLVVSSGLYVSKKVYTASPYQYKFAGYAPQNLKEVGADCKVYEIPVMVYYSSKQVKNHNWLGGVGLSSLLMKKEAYDYRYETPAGQTWNYEKTVTNENKHYFSVVTISGGYQYKLNNMVSFIAEPYVKIPLTGIGVGKLKLNSTGVLVTAAIKPFAKKKK